MRSLSKKKIWIVILIAACFTAGAAVKVSLDSPATFPVDI